MRDLLRHPLLWQFIRFAAVGLVGTLIQYATMLVGTDVLGVRAFISSDVGFALGCIANYTLNYFLTFKSGKSHREAAAKYFTIVGVGFGLNTLLMKVLVDNFAWNHWLAQFLTTGIGLVWNFTGSRFWAFRESHRHG